MASSPRLAGRYRFLRELGRGASGRVVLAADEQLEGLERALKVVGETDAARLVWEHELLTGINHPNVAAVHELLTVKESVGPPFRVSGGSTVLVEDFVPGTTADAAVRAVADAERVDWVLRVGVAAGRALAAIHAVGLVHGDVKPENLVVGEDPETAVLVDLGLARPPALEATAAGTPAFLAPEAWHGERSVAVDVYALGATLHHLLGGKSALTDTRGGSVAELWARASARPRTSAGLPATVPSAVGRVIDAMLSGAPEQRPGSAREVVARLATLRAELGGAAVEAAIAELSESPTAEERAMAMSVLSIAGRGAELASLGDAMASSGLVVVRGPSGAGRTRLVREGVRRFQQKRAAAGEAVPTFTVVASHLAEPPRHDAVALFTEGDRLDLREARALLADAELDGRSLVIVAECTTKVPGANGVVEVNLGAVDAESIENILAEALGSRPSATLVDAAVEASGALPGRLCRLLAAALLEGRDLTRPETLRAMSAGGGSETILPARGRALANHLAIAGGSLPIAVLSELLPDDLSGALSALSSDGAVTFGRDGAPRLRRDLVATLHAGSSPEERGAIAATLLPSALPDEPRAFVFAAHGDAEAAGVHILRSVGARRARGDAEGAIGLAALATALFPSPPPALALARADALRARGRYEEALASLDAVLDDDLPAAAPLRAEVLRLLGRHEEAEQVLDAPVARGDLMARATAARLRFDGGDPGGARADALAVAAAAAAAGDETAEARGAEVAALAALYEGASMEAMELADRAIAAAGRAGARGIEARAHAVAAQVALSTGEVRRAAERYARAFDIAAGAGEEHAAAAFLLNVGVTRLDAGELGPAHRALKEGARRLSQLGRDLDLSRALYNLGLASVLAGDDDLGRAAVSGAREAADRAGDHSAGAFASILDSELALRAGSIGRARAALAEAEERAAAAPPRDAVVVFARRAQLLAVLGDLAGARVALEGAVRGAADDGSDLCLTECAVAEVRVALAEGDTTAAVASAAKARSSAERFGTYEARLRASLSSADAADASGDRDAARRFLSTSRTLLDSAANTLRPSARARMRAVGAYQRAFSAVPPADRARDDGDRYRRLVFYARRLTAERRIGRLYEEVLDAAIDLSGAERGFVLVRDDDGTLRIRVARGLDKKALARDERGFSRSLAARAIDGGVPVSTVDAISDASLHASASVHSLALRSVVALPLKHEGEVRGALYLDDRLRPGAFDGADVALLADLCDIASIALDGAERLRRERRQARRLEVRGRRLEERVEAQARQLESLRIAAGAGGEDLGIVGTSAAMNRTLSLVRRVAPSNVSVLVTGESGTGKELVAKALHSLSAHADGPFVTENVSAIPETLLESELFGHVRGAFTGAERARIGLFEAASGGTLFLDEIGEMSPAMQAKLLRAVQEGEIRPVGAEQPRAVDVRVVAATHRDLSQRVAEGLFREDLYYRLAVVTVELPPLRERREDVPALVEAFVARHAGGRDVLVDGRAMAALSSFGWPGNVRQLENEVRRALVMSTDVIRLEHLSESVRGDAADEGVGALDLKGQVRVLERRLIKDALSHSGGNQTKAAKLLGVSRYGLQKMIKRLGE